MQLDFVFEWIGLVVLLFLSGFFSASETALTSLGKLRTKTLLEREGDRAKDIRLWADDPNRFLATILVGNNVVNIGASVLAAFLAVRIVGDKLTAGIAWSVTAVMTFLILIFGELVPKTFARENAEKVALQAIGFLRVLSRILAPFIKVFLFISRTVIRILGGAAAKPGPFMTEEEIKTLIGLGEEEGVLEEGEREMLESIFEFGDTKVQEVMVPRMEMVCIRVSAKLSDILSLLVKAGYSRIPVYEGTIDNITGLLYAKDLLKFWGEYGEKQLVLKDFMRQPYFVPEAKKVNELLREFQRNRSHMAIVVDEYGGTAGLVTMEDLIEEIVGEIEDEHDREGRKIEHLEGREVLVDARIDIGELNEELGVSFPEQEGVETLAGFIISLLGRVPPVGEIIEHERLKIRVVEATKRRVGKVRISGIARLPGNSEGVNESDTE